MTTLIDIRPLLFKDAERLAEYANNKKIADNLRDYFPQPYSLNDATGFIEFVQKDDGNYIFAITLSNEFVGIMGAHSLTDIYRTTAEVGYWLGEPFWGQGITKKALKLLDDWLWKETSFVRLEAGVFEPNIGSMKVLEANGFQLESIRKKRLIKNGQIYDEYMYSKLRQE